MPYRCSKCHKMLAPRRYYHKSGNSVFKCQKHGEVYIEKKYHNPKAIKYLPFEDNLTLYLKCKKDIIKDLLLYIEEKLSPHNEIYKTIHSHYPIKIKIYHYRMR